MNVFDTLLNEILPGVTAEDHTASFHRPFKHDCLRSRAYFLDAPGGTEKIFTIGAILAILRFRGRKLISVATSAVAASLLEGEENPTPYSKYQSLAPKIAFILSQWFRNWPILFVKPT